MTNVQDKMTGGQFLARTLHGYGVTCVFFVESILRQTLIELEALGVRRVLTHSEKAAAYMAEVAGRLTRSVGVCAVSGAVAAAAARLSAATIL